ncbi:MAG: DUF2442 domain-containing protein [Acidobacteriia bacterium]|nr:DUF2442 domain-containing protein [Terriglobia bacterium]
MSKRRATNTQRSAVVGYDECGAKVRTQRAQRVIVSEVSLIVDLADGRTISAPLAWYPRLLHGTPAERENWRLIGDGEGIHWPDLDEDLSVEGLILGQPWGESSDSLKRWLEARKVRKNRAGNRRSAQSYRTEQSTSRRKRER